jgi:hypothetical protein
MNVDPVIRGHGQLSTTHVHSSRNWNSLTLALAAFTAYCIDFKKLLVPTPSPRPLFSAKDFGP